MNEMIIRTSGHVSGGKTNREAALYAPYIDPNTNTWWQYNKETQMFEDTGAVPYGLKGEKGDPGDNYVLTPEDIEYILEDLRSQIVVNSDTVNGHTVQSDVPVGAVFTDTTYNNATPSTDGLMSAADKQAVDALNLRSHSYGSELPSAITTLFSTHELFAYRMGRLVILHFNFNLASGQSVTTGQFYTLITLDPEYRPAYGKSYILPTQGANSSGVLVTTNYNGTVQMYFAVQPGGFIRGACVYESQDN